MSNCKKIVIDLDTPAVLASPCPLEPAGFLKPVEILAPVGREAFGTYASAPAFGELTPTFADGPKAKTMVGDLRPMQEATVNIPKAMSAPRAMMVPGPVACEAAGAFAPSPADPATGPALSSRVQVTIIVDEVITKSGKALRVQLESEGRHFSRVGIYDGQCNSLLDAIEKAKTMVVEWEAMQEIENPIDTWMKTGRVTIAGEKPSGQPNSQQV